MFKQEFIQTLPTPITFPKRLKNKNPRGNKNSGWKSDFKHLIKFIHLVWVIIQSVWKEFRSKLSNGSCSIYFYFNFNFHIHCRTMQAWKCQEFHFALTHVLYFVRCLCSPNKRLKITLKLLHPSAKKSNWWLTDSSLIQTGFRSDFFSYPIFANFFCNIVLNRKQFPDCVLPLTFIGMTRKLRSALNHKLYGWDFGHPGIH